MVSLLVGGIALLLVAIAFLVMWANRAGGAGKRQDAAVAHLREVCDEFERGFVGQVRQLGIAESVEGKLRARLIAACYVMQGLIDLERNKKASLLRLTNEEKWAVASGVAAKPLNVVGSADELRIRRAATELVATMIDAISEHDIETLSKNWLDALLASGYRRNLDATVDRRVQGWCLQSAIAGMKCWSDLAAG